MGWTGVCKWICPFDMLRAGSGGKESDSVYCLIRHGEQVGIHF